MLQEKDSRILTERYPRRKVMATALDHYKQGRKIHSEMKSLKGVRILMVDRNTSLLAFNYSLQESENGNIQLRRMPACPISANSANS